MGSLATGVFLGLGSNMEPGKNLRAAIGHLSELPGTTLLEASRVFRTPPWGYESQEPFLNAVLSAATALEPTALLDRLQEIEGRLRRKRTFRHGPRTIDLDILLFGNLVMDTARLAIPHPEMHRRGFVLVPLCDLAPDLTHPALGQSMRELAEQADRSGIEPVELNLPLPPPPRSPPVTLP